MPTNSSAATFGEQKAENTDAVLDIWKKVKAQEHKKRVVGGLFDGIPPQLSALRYALDIAKKGDAQILDTAAKNCPESLKIGRELFEIVRKAAAAKIEPEGALRDYIAEIRRISENSAAEK